MTFSVRDLMIDVLPANFADADGLRLCEGNITMTPQPAPKPKPKPKPKPPGLKYAVGDEVQAAPQGAAELAPLSVLREQLRQALHP